MGGSIKVKDSFVNTGHVMVKLFARDLVQGCFVLKIMFQLNLLKRLECSSVLKKTEGSQKHLFFATKKTSQLPYKLRLIYFI